MKAFRLLTRRMNKLKTVIVPIVMAAALIAAAPGAEALPLAPGGIVPAIGIPFPGGTELDSVSYVSQSSASLTVDVASAVFRNGAGTLDFYYQVSNHSVRNRVHRLTGSDFSGFITDVWYVTNGAAVSCDACPGDFFVNGTQAPLSVDRDTFGEVVGFNFPNPGFELLPGQTSVLLLVRTNATDYVPGFVSVINSGTVTQPAFAPAAAVTPEPASMVLFGIGLLGTGAAMRRKRKA